MKFNRLYQQSVLCILILISLLGCGGGGSSAGNASLQVRSLNSTVTLPSGFRGVAFDRLLVRTSAKDSTISATGDAAVSIFNEGPHLAEVLDGDNRTVLMGYLSSGKSDLSVRSTTVAVAFLALGGAFMKEDGRLVVLDQVATLDGFDTFEAAVESTLVSAGFLDLEDEGLQSALTSFVGPALKGGRSVIVEPTNASGLSVDSTVADKLTYENVFLRRVTLFMTRTGYRNANGQDIDEDNNPWIKNEMPLVSRFGGTTATIDAYIRGEVPYSPVRSTPFDIPRYPANAQRTYYLVTAVGPGLNPGDEAGLDTQKRDELMVLNLKTIFIDVFLVLMANTALPLKGSEVDEYLNFVAGNAVITDLLNNLRTTVPLVGELAGRGKYWDAFLELIKSSYTSNTILPFVAQLTVDFIDNNASLSQAQYDKIFGGFQTALARMGNVDAGAALVDTGILLHDLASSDQAKRFEITVIPGKITLSAARTTIRPTGTTTITATIQDRDPNGTYEFEWTVLPNSDYWVEDRFLVGTDDFPSGLLTTAENVVNIRSLITTNGTATVKCEAFRLDGGRRQVGEDEVVINFDTQAENITTTIPTIIADKVIYPLLDGGFSGSYALYYLVPIPEGVFFQRITCVAPQSTGYAYTRQWYEPRTNPYISIQAVNSLLVSPPPPGFYKVFVRGGWDGRVGGWTTQAAAQASLDSVTTGNLNHYLANTTTRIEAYFP